GGGVLAAGLGGAGARPAPRGDGHAGAGLGVRYDVGIGPLRLDIAAPVRGGPRGVSLYLGIGQAF
ncbi:MAG: BamA/TamA family outer membrane protein, partial [Rhodobacteraceae bacterium]|nr:BamA/TamA family outer membrane protein [Paracoccaceae bacterium]